MIIAFGVLSMLLQAAMFAAAYPRFVDQPWRIVGGMRVAAVAALLSWSFTTLRRRREAPNDFRQRLRPHRDVIYRGAIHVGESTPRPEFARRSRINAPTRDLSSVALVGGEGHFDRRCQSAPQQSLHSLSRRRRERPFTKTLSTL